MDFYVYEHWRPDTGTCFYVGKGKHGRAQSMRCRNQHHQSIQAKLAAAGLAVDVRIVRDRLSEAEAFSAEKALIASWRASGAVLANKSSGGEGVADIPQPVDTRAKRSASMKEAHARKRAEGISYSKGWARPDTSERLAKQNREKAWTEEERRATREAALRQWEAQKAAGFEVAAETRQKISASHKARWADFHAQGIRRKWTTEALEKRSASVRGSKRSPETRAKMSAAIKAAKARRREAIQNAHPA